MRTCLYSDVEIDLSNEEIDTIFQKVFGTSTHTYLAEEYIRKKDGWCVLDCDGCIFGYSRGPLQRLKDNYNVVFLSQVTVCSIGSM